MFQPSPWFCLKFVPRLKHSIYLALLAFFVSSQAHAAAIGLPEHSIRFGFGASLSNVSVNDEVNRTEKVTSSQAGSLYLSDWLNKKTRYLAELYIANHAFDASSGHVGQSVSQRGIRFSAQINRPLGKYISPWFGGGFDLSYSSYKKRHSVDSDGYLTERYADLNKPSLGLIVNVMEKWNINKYAAVLAKLEYSAPITQTVSGISTSIIFLFRPTF